MSITDLTNKEATALEQVVAKTRRAISYMNETPHPTTADARGAWIRYYANLKAILGNMHNDISYIATLLAKEYLFGRWQFPEADATTKAQGAPEIDIDWTTLDGKRIIAEIKTTSPCNGPTFGGNQITEIKKDLRRLRETQADQRFLFVTDLDAYRILRKSYSPLFSGIALILLPEDVEHGGKPIAGDD